jgi:hypothetical protein
MHFAINKYVLLCVQKRKIALESNKPSKPCNMQFHDRKEGIKTTAENEELLVCFLESN